ncbi:MAG: ATP-binding cassette domain-containing protein [Anaerolineae bacterium]|nr:ATP-binding cassette domain-containing protein [Anaerolineae bacterium]
MNEEINTQNRNLLQVKNLKMHFPIYKPGIRHRISGYIRAVDGINFFVRPGETLGLVGESGCGKTTTGRCIMRIYQPTAGEVLYQNGGGQPVDLTQVQGRDLDPYRRQIRMIFQDPYGSLNPRMNVRDIIGEPLFNNKITNGKELEDRVADLLRRVGLRPEYMHRYPHAFSGGERQRIGIARALTLSPKLVIADEPVSALDVSVRAQVLNLLLDLQEEYNLTYIFVAHDLSVVRYICDRVTVMYVGKIAEVAGTEALYTHPLHPYTEALMMAVPIPDPRLRRTKRILLEGEVADPSNPPSGCYFHPRCRYAEEQCVVEHPELREVEPDRYVACHFAEKLALRGVESS